jgi:cellulose synthase/poly-beta-1,6-N-acetylglucosamine synthase-like glycosyltransferase
MWIVEIILLAYFVYVVVYTAVFSFGGLFYKANVSKSDNKYFRFCVLIPSYKEDAVILDVAEKNLRQDFPHDSFDIVVIADSLQPATVAALRRLPIRVIEVFFESSTKVKSLNMALGELPNNYDYAVILDADNIMEPDYLRKMNGELLRGNFKAVQGQRKPKNNNNTLSFLDGVSEAINNHVYRQGSAALGLSASIAGSGIVFDYALLKRKLSTMSSIGGFDRELELLLIKEGISVRYFKSAIVLDEKISQNKAFQNQRKRWISSQYFYLRKYFGEGMTALFRGNFTFFNSAVLRNIQLPRLLNIGLLTVLTIALFFVRTKLYFGYDLWLALFLIHTVAIFVSIPREFYTRQMLTSIASLPGLFFRMFLLLFKLKGANKKFIHTPHGVAGESVK